MKVYGFKVQNFFKEFADAMAATFLVLTTAWNLNTAVPWEDPMYVAGYGFLAYTMKRMLDLMDKVKQQ